MKDFVFDKEGYHFVHEESGFMLDADFVLLFEDDFVKRIFAGGSGKDMSDETLSELRNIVREHEKNG